MSAGAGTTCCRYFRRSEHHHARADDVHGQGGEWRVERQRLHWDILDAVRDAALELGIPKVDDFNGGDNEGSAYFEVNQQRGVRWNTTKAFLAPARRRRQSACAHRAQVERVDLADHRVTGVRFRMRARSTWPLYGARSSSRPEPSARRSSWSCRASAARTC